MSKKLRLLREPLPLGRRSNPWEGRCVLIVGRLGSGKTSYAVHRAVRLARRYRLPLYANAKIRPDAGLLRTWGDLRALPLDDLGRHPAVILLDELHLWYSSAQGLMDRDDQRDAFELLSFARKRGWTVFATSQAVTRVHTGYRQLMTELLRVHPVAEGYLHRVAALDCDSGQEFLAFAGLFSPRRARYDTRAEVAPLWSVGAGDRRSPVHPTTGTPQALYTGSG